MLSDHRERADSGFSHAKAQSPDTTVSLC